MRLYTSSEFNSLLPPSDYGKQIFQSDFHPAGVQVVRQVRLDELMDELDLDGKRVLLKLDTQGRDLAVLAGARRCMPSIVAIQSELSALALYDHMTPMSEALTHFSALGFSPSGMFPVVRDPHSMAVIEWDCVMIRPAGKSI